MFSLIFLNFTDLLVHSATHTAGRSSRLGLGDIGNYAFSDCDNLIKFAVAENNAAYTCENAILYSKDKTTLYQVFGTPTTVNVPETVTSIEEYAFSGCTALQKVCVQEEEWQWSTYQDILSEDLPEIVRMIFASAVSCFNIE